MNKIYIKDLINHIDDEIDFSGFVDTVRDKKWVQFVILKDHTGKIQMTIEKENENNKKMVELISSITKDSVIKIKCKVIKNENVKLGGIELIPTNIEVLSEALELPFDYNNLDGVNIDTRLDYRWLDIRNEKNNLIRLVESTFTEGVREFLYKNEFNEIHSPKLIKAASESGSEVFRVDYFNNDAYLAQSDQFYKQMAIASNLSKVFEIGPTFRAENSNTNRHATEYTCIDVEMAYIDSYEDIMSLEEDLIIAGLTKVKERYEDKIKELFDKEIIIPKKPFPRIRLNDLMNELKEKYNYNIPSECIGDMNADAEKLSYKYAMEKYNHEFLFVVDYSAEKRPFYHMRKDGILQGYDLLWRGMEITSGSQREHRYEYLKKQADEKKLTKDVEFYLKFFKYGCPPHGGFGLGLDRMTMLLLGLPSLKETMFIFRGPNRLEP